ASLFSSLLPRHPLSTLFPYTTLFRSPFGKGMPLGGNVGRAGDLLIGGWQISGILTLESGQPFTVTVPFDNANINPSSETVTVNRSEEHTSELQSRFDLVCRLLLEKKK